MDNGDANDSGAAHRDNHGKFRGKTAGGVAVVAVLAVYSLVQPWLNQRMGWNLPGLRQDSRGQIVADNSDKHDRVHTAPVAQTKSKESNAKSEEKTDTAKPSANSSQPKPATTPSADKSKPTKPSIKRGPLADRMRPSKSGGSKSPRGPPKTSPADEDLLYGLLREVGRERYMSPAGLQYGPGSAEGHRLEHLRRHVSDIPGRPLHGVFDGDMEGALKTIDQAYEKAKQGIRTSKKVDRDRTIYTVDMGKRIGFAGGKEGSQRRNPMARRVRLVLEGNQVITAYPVQ